MRPLALLALLLATPAAAQQPTPDAWVVMPAYRACAPAAKWRALIERTGETVTFSAPSAGGGLFVVSTNRETGEWTAVVLEAEGRVACIVAGNGPVGEGS